MSFESARKMGLIASLIVVIVPVVVVIFDVVSLLSLFGVVFSPGVAGRSPLSPFILGGLNYTLIALSAVGLAGVALFFVAMNTLSHYYSESGIFKNALYGFIIGIVGTAVFYGILIAIVLVTAFSAVGHPSTSFSPLGAIIAIIGLLAGFFAVAIVAAILYKRAFDKLAEKSGVRSFGTAGELILIGTALSIVFVGVIIAWIAWIYVLSGFNSLKPKSQEAVPRVYSTTQPLYSSSLENKRYCIYCGQEINVDSDYCPHCGRQQH